MARLIETREGILIEVESDSDSDQKCAAGSAKKVEKGLDQIAPLLGKACETMKNFWQEEVKDVAIEEVQIQFGLNFEAGGSIYIAQVKSGASVSVTATLKKLAK